MAKKRKTTGGKPGGKKQRAGKKKGQSSNLPLTAVIIIVAIAIGAGGGILAWYLTNNDTASGIELPAFAYDATAPKGAPEAYQAALDIPDYLEQVPCYCGCGAFDGHENNLDCFVESRQGDKVEWDDHAAG